LKKTTKGKTWQRKTERQSATQVTTSKFVLKKNKLKDHPDYWKPDNVQKGHATVFGSQGRSSGNKTRKRRIGQTEVMWNNRVLYGGQSRKIMVEA